MFTQKFIKSSSRPAAMARAQYITAKLRKDKFKPIIEELEKKAGVKARSDNNVVGACVFFTHACITHPVGKQDETLFDVFSKLYKMNPSEIVLKFMNAYYQFLRSESLDDFMKLHKAETQKK